MNSLVPSSVPMMGDATTSMDLQFVIQRVLPLAFFMAVVAVLVVRHTDGRLAGKLPRTGPFVGRVVATLDEVDVLLERWYARMGVWGGSVVIALVLMFVVFHYVLGGTKTFSHGELYTALSNNPFDPNSSNALRTRILAPLIGWVFHLRGPLFVLVPWIFLVGLLALVNVWSRREGANPTLGLCLMLAIAFSPVTMHTLVGPGYIEAVSYFLVGMALLNVQNAVPACIYMALAVMAHEASAFLVPAWLMAGLRGMPTKMWFRRIALLCMFLLPYAAYRWWVVQVDLGVYSTTFYFSAENVEACLDVGPLASVMGTFAVFRLHWVILLVPVFKNGLHDGRVQWALLLLISVGMTLLIAYDTTRMLCWTFPLLVIGGVELGKCVGRNRAVALFLTAAVLNFMITPYTTTAAVSYRLDSVRVVLGL